MTESPRPIGVELFIDPCCPWAWLTSRWLAEVERVRPLRVVTRLFDLAEINREHDEGRARESHAAGESALRVLVVARRAGGPKALADAYSAIGDAYHEHAEPLSEVPVLARALSAAGLDPALAEEALADPSTLDELLAEHREAVQRGAFGVPTLSVDGGPAFFGPIVDTRIVGEAAGELWNRVDWLLRSEHVFEIKRTRTRKAQVGRYLLETARSGTG